MPKTQKRSDMPAEHNATGARDSGRGKYYEALQHGHSVRIHEDDGTTTIQYYQLEEGAVLLDPDVREYFPDAQAVNAALRSLIALIPSQPRRRKRSKVETEAAR